MLKHILAVFILGVLLREASADIECFLNKAFNYLNLPSDETILCNNYVNGLRDKLKSCDVTEVNFDKLESHVKEMCIPGSQLKKDMDASQSCFKEHMPDFVKCMPRISPKASTVERTKAICKVRKDLYSCTKKHLGEPCGEAGVNVVTKGKEVEESYMKDICALVGGAAINSVVMWLLVLCVSITMLKSH